MPAFTIGSTAKGSTNPVTTCGDVSYHLLVKDEDDVLVETTFASYIEGWNEVRLNVLDNVSVGNYSLSLQGLLKDHTDVNETVYLFDVIVNADQPHQN